MKHLNKNETKSYLIKNHFINAPLAHTLTENDLTEYFSNIIKTTDIDYLNTSTKYEDIIDTATSKLGSGATKTDVYNLDKADRLLDMLDIEVKEISEAAAKEVVGLINLEKEYCKINIAPQAPIADLTELNNFKNEAYSTALNEKYPENRLNEKKEELAIREYSNNPSVMANLAALNAHFSIGMNPLEAIYANKAVIESAINDLKTKKTSFDSAAGAIINTANFNTYKTNFEAAERIYEEFQEVNIGLRGTITNMEAFKTAVYTSAILQQFPENFISIHKNSLAESAYSNDFDVVADLALLDGLLSTNPVESIITNKKEVEKIIKRLKDKKTSFDTAAGTVINTTGFNTFKTEYENTKKEYDETREKLAVYVQDPANPTDINGAILNFFNTYGTDILQNIDDHMKGYDGYTTAFNAYVAHQYEKTRVPDFIKDALEDLDALIASGILEEKKRALKAIKKLHGNIEKIIPDASKGFNRFLQRTYHHVIMASELDESNINREYNWVMFAGENHGKPVSHHGIGTYAQAGLGYYFEVFADPYLNAGNNNVKSLEGTIVNKHKKASSTLFGGFNRKKHKISVKEALKLGLGYGITKSGEDMYHEVADMWESVNDLDANSTIAEIIETYDEAADVGEHINHTAESWTYRHDTGYDALDDEVNKLAGGAFTFMDWLGGVGRGLLEKAGFSGFGASTRKSGYDVDKESAIQPNSHPHLKSILTAAAILYGGYVTVDAIGKALQDEEKGAPGALHEIMEGVAAIAGFELAEKVLAPKPKQTAHAATPVTAAAPATTAHTTAAPVAHA